MKQQSSEDYKELNIDLQGQSKNIEQLNISKLRIGVTHGDFNGINYEILFKALSQKGITDLITPIVYGSSKLASFFKKYLGINDFGFNFIKNIDGAIGNNAYLVSVSDKEYKIEFGNVSQSAGECAFLALEQAVKDIKAKKIDAIVTAPINKNSINLAGFKFPGHTEYFANRFRSNNSLMLMISDNLRIAIATNHVPLEDLKNVITKDLILHKLDILNFSLKRDFAIDRPKIAVLSLNPHAGDGGVIGDEELNVILPAVEQARNNGLIVNGPFAADGFFGSARMYEKFDAILAMYHDQGMIPFKMLAEDNGVNFTAGLPIVRTSPAHGTAFDIAGKNMASHSMLSEAIYYACEICKNRMEYDMLTANPLE